MRHSVAGTKVVAQIVFSMPPFHSLFDSDGLAWLHPLQKWMNENVNATVLLPRTIDKTRARLAQTTEEYCSDIDASSLIKKATHGGHTTVRTKVLWPMDGFLTRLVVVI